MSGWARYTGGNVLLSDEAVLALSREYPYYDPIYMLPESGRAWWRASGSRQGQAGILKLADAVG